MKILQISSAQSLGGGERHLADLAGGLAKLGHDVYAAIRPNSPLLPQLKTLPNKNITTLPLRNALDAISARGLARLVSQNQIQIIHAHMARDYPLAAYAARKNPGARLIITRHVLFPLNRLHRITLAKAARIIAVSEAVARQLRIDGIASVEKLSVVLNGIDTRRFVEARANFDRRHLLERWRLPEQSLLVGTVGELTPLKGQEDFLHAVLKVSPQFPTAHFIIAGLDHTRTKEYLTRLEKLIEQPELRPYVTLIGWVEDLAQLYSALDVFVSSSHTESFGLAIAEAMASSTAVVATATEGARELVRPRETGLLVPIGAIDQIAQEIAGLLSDADKRIRLGQAAQAFACANFSLERMIAETERIYEEVLQKD